VQSAQKHICLPACHKLAAREMALTKDSSVTKDAGAEVSWLPKSCGACLPMRLWLRSGIESQGSFAGGDVCRGMKEEHEMKQANK
jgi:hypothetical protein